MLIVAAGADQVLIQVCYDNILISGQAVDRDTQIHGNGLAFGGKL
jgi:hypothetical protein